MPKDVSIIIPAYNEEKNIEAAIDNVVRAIADVVDDYEIIVINDGSGDRTGILAEEKAKNNPKIRVFHNETNRGYGYTYQRGIQLSTRTYISGFPGDNDASGESLRDLMKEIGTVDLITAYMADMSKRSLLRRVVSRLFVVLMNCLFGLHLRYYNGLLVYKRSAIQSITIKSRGLATIAECIVKLIKSGCSYKEICFHHMGRQAGKSTAFTARNAISIIKTIFILIQDVYFRPVEKNRKESWVTFY